MAPPAINNHSSGMLNFLDGNGDVNTNTGTGPQIKGNIQELNYHNTQNVEKIIQNFMFIAADQFEQVAPWRREYSNARSRYPSLPNRNRPRDYEPIDYEPRQYPPPESASSPSSHPLQSIHANMTGSLDPAANPYSTGRRSFSQTYGPATNYNYYDQMEDDYFPEPTPVFRRRERQRYAYAYAGERRQPLATAVAATREDRIPVAAAAASRTRTFRSRSGSPTFPGIKRTNSGLRRTDSGLSLASISRSATPFEAEPRSPRTQRDQLSALTPPPGQSRLREELEPLLDSFTSSLNTRSEEEEIIRQGSRDYSGQETDVMGPRESPSKTDYYPQRIPQHVVVFPVSTNLAQVLSVLGELQVDSDRSSPAGKMVHLIVSGGAAPSRKGRSEQRENQTQEQQKSQPRLLPPTSTEPGSGSDSDSDSEIILTGLVVNNMNKNMETTGTGSGESTTISVSTSTSSTNSGAGGNNIASAIWPTNMSSMSLLAIGASAGVLGYHHTPFLLQSVILYLRELTVLHGGILRVFYLYESLLCSSVVVRGGLLFK